MYLCINSEVLSLNLSVVFFAKMVFFDTEVGTTQIWRKHGGIIRVKRCRQRADGKATFNYELHELLTNYTKSGCQKKSAGNQKNSYTYFGQS